MTDATKPQKSRPVASRGGVVATVVLCAVFLLYSAALAVAGLFIGFYSDSCGGEGTCNGTELEVAVWLAFFGVSAIALALIIVAIVRIVRRRAFVWVLPLAGFVVNGLLFWIANSLGAASAGLNFWTHT